MLKKFLLFLFPLVLFFLFVNNSFAQTSEDVEITGDGKPLEEIDGNTNTVTIKFNDLSEENYYVCLSSDECMINTASGSKTKKAKISSSILTSGINVCAAGDNYLKAVKESCSSKDYFHEGKFYKVELFIDDDLTERGPKAAFFVNHFYPDASTRIDSTSGLLEVTLSGKRKPETSEKRNNYEIVVEGIDKYGNRYKKDKCTTLSQETSTVRFGSKSDDNKPIVAGSYLVKINEQINDGSGSKIRSEKCAGGFTFWHINTIIKSDGEIEFPATCLGQTEENQKECVKDPNSSDLKALSKFLGELLNVPSIKLRCNGYEVDKKGNYQCVAIDTAIGTIPTNPIAFIERLFNIVLSIAGVGALGLLIYGGYNYMVSRGDPERIKGARETITSAIIGLLFIIFSLVILQVIAGDILNIPGFN